LLNNTGKKPIAVLNIMKGIEQLPDNRIAVIKKMKIIMKFINLRDTLLTKFTTPSKREITKKMLRDVTNKTEITATKKSMCTGKKPDDIIAEIYPSRALEK